MRKDTPRAKSLYERAINEGNEGKAMFNLGNLLQDGADGVAKNSVSLFTVRM